MDYLLFVPWLVGIFVLPAAMVIFFASRVWLFLRGRHKTRIAQIVATARRSQAPGTRLLKKGGWNNHREC